MDELELKIDEANELLFQVKIEGTREQPTAIRFVCESTGMSFMFDGTNGEEPGEIKVVVPPMFKHLAEGDYDARLEVLIEGKYVSPLSMRARFSKSMTIVAESKSNKQAKPTLKIEARALSLKDYYLKRKTK